MNSGFESDEPEVIISKEVARNLRINLRRLSIEGLASIEEYKGAGGRRFKAHVLKYGFAKAWVIAEDRDVGPVDITLTIVAGEREILISDKATDCFRIIILKPGEGLWRFEDDPPGKTRRSFR